MRVAVLGATGLVGSEMVKVLEERAFPLDDLVPLASERSAGREVIFKGRPYVVRAVKESAFEGIDVALFSAGSGPSRKWAPVAASKGAVVIDNSSAWRMEEDVPLVVPEVNPHALDKHKGIIANPNCATIQALVALKPLHDAFGLKSMQVVTLQSVSGTGLKALDELREGSKAVLEGIPPMCGLYPKPIAFNVLPHIGKIDEKGISEEEYKMMNESKKIMELPNLAVSCTAVRVPVFRGHSEAVIATFEKDPSLQDAIEALSKAPGVSLTEDPLYSYVVPSEVEGKDPVFVGRIRKEPSPENSLSFWVVADNIRKGAALNAVQVAEELIKRELL